LLCAGPTLAVGIALGWSRSSGRPRSSGRSGFALVAWELAAFGRRPLELRAR
jgi:hypothetical protein